VQGKGTREKKEGIFLQSIDRGSSENRLCNKFGGKEEKWRSGTSSEGRGEKRRRETAWSSCRRDVHIIPYVWKERENRVFRGKGRRPAGGGGRNSLSRVDVRGGFAYEDCVKVLGEKKGEGTFPCWLAGQGRA